MARIVGFEKEADTAKITLEVNDIEIRNIDLNEPIMLFSKKNLGLRSTTHKVSSQQGFSSTYALLPNGLKKLTDKLNLDVKQEFDCGIVEAAEGGYIILHYSK